MFKNFIEEILSFFKCIYQHPFRYSIIIFFMVIYIHSELNIKFGDINIIKNIFSRWNLIYQGVGAHIAVLWAMYLFDKNMNIKKQEKSANIAKEFAEHFADELSIIFRILAEDRELLEVAKKTKNCTDFNLNEANSLFKNFDKINLKIKKALTQDDNIQEKYNQINKDRKYPIKFGDLVENTINKLEAICMDITSGAANSNFIYTSLHQTFLPAINILWPYIAGINKDNINYHYTNIIYVYNEWNNRRLKDIKKLEKTKNKIMKINKKAQKEIENLLKIKPKTV